MNLKLHLILLVFINVCNLTAQVENVVFTQLPSELGLNNTGITAIAQDSRSQLWFGTWVGLYRYDGSNAKLYKSNLNSENSITSNKITHILSTSNGELFVATLRGGVLKYRFEYDDFIEVKFDDNNSTSLRSNVWHLYEDKSQNVWAATEKGIGILKKGKTTFENDDIFLKSKINSKRVQYITDASSDYVWVGTEDGVFVYFMDKKGNLNEISHYNFHFLEYTYEQSNYIYGINKVDNEKYFVLCKSGIVELDVSNGFEKPIYKLIEKTGHGFDFPRVLTDEGFFDNKNLLGTNDGIRFINNQNFLTDKTYLKGKVIRTIYKDSFGSLWLGTENGLFKLIIDTPLVKKFSFEENSNLEFSTIENINQSSDKNNIWMAWQHGMLSNIKLSDLSNKNISIKHYQVLKPNGKIVKDRISQLTNMII